MLNTKLLASILLVLAVMFGQLGNAAAAPPTQEGTTTIIKGTINEITTELDANGETIIIVKLTDEQGASHIVTLSAQEAAANNLFDLDTQELLAQANDSVDLEVDPNDVVPGEEPAEPDVHPISLILAKFFFNNEEDPNMTSEMASLIDSLHTGDNEADQVFGFGVITQALWMSKNINAGTPDANLAAEILLAKQSGNYSAIELPEDFSWPDDSAPTNWGQFRKAIKERKENKEKQNLGVIVSEQAEDSSQDSTLQQNPQDKGKEKNNKDNKGKDKEKKKP